MRRRNIAGTVAVCALLLVGCGGDSDGGVTQRSIAEKVQPPANALIAEADVTSADSGSAAQAFLAYWSSLQWQAWPESARFFSPAFQDYIGTGRIVEALKSQAAFFRSTKPEIKQEYTRNGLRIVRYEFVDGQGRKTTSSTTWQRQNGSWLLVYDSYLDIALRGWAQAREQQTTDPGARTPSAKALQAGIQASELQSAFLETARRERANAR